MSHPKPQTTGDRLRAARLAAGLTQSGAAQANAMLQSDWSKIERGEITPSLDRLHRLALAIGADPASIDARLASTSKTA